MLILSDTHLNNIEYAYHTGRDYSLYPVRGIDTPKDIKIVKDLIKKQTPDARIHIRWKDPDDTSSIPLKVPENAIIKNLQKTVGQNEAYIQELEEQIKTLKDTENKIISKENKKELMKDVMIKQYSNKVKELTRQIELMRKDNSDLISTNLMLKTKYEGGAS